MDTLTFIAELVKALAWPLTAITIFLILRRPLLAVFPLMQRLRFQGIEIDFNRQIHALAVEARSQLPAVDSNKTENLRRHWTELATLSPRAVVLEAWVELEQAAIEASRRHNLTLKSAELRAPLILGQALEEAGILEENTPSIYHQLRNLRNAAAHASEFAFNPESAIQYADLALRLIEYLKRT